ncbi:MAG: hypothetical protein A3A80_02070 [Candidatus Terrybacteria bacterium RIFCSPLOWO2_01_FULL_44_24]|uniref:Translation elongation factor-like protein n=1 Tax=Candidatus Terrybacteria bacterium RIFCSPHIGHO2_01_FULL_43_35 TaxID=1802361 RepID=A0A1G2PFV0_9BACT|nr:MAG: hypothetical protein A2828_01860 [Candidatus Terrybacteria bacterium RIFCSPHIGHO2_01_FULL_43_35]OHA50867.1 MAG: hypothetical protein A3A80_02070 [Candidatus Terrybacteria bacterium RIFCSPLOWO2_01_FULL_44_24]
MEEKQIATITHFYGNIGVAVLKLSGPLKIGDSIHVKGASADFIQQVSSMEVDHKAIASASTGDEIGMKLDQKTKAGDKVFLAN